MTEQRRLAAILVADVVGYSKLIGNDEAGTLAQLQVLRKDVIEPQIAKHAGRLFKAVGDGFLVEFASAVQAVSCAKAIQDANSHGRLPLRIGIHLGDVVVQGDDLMGDGVNVAARVEAIAEPGGIAVTRSVHEQVRDKLDLRFLDKGEIELKNIQRPVQVFVAGGMKVDHQAAVLPLPDKPSIAVLPFQNMSDDPEQEYFADGMAEDTITALSRFKSLFVVARNSSFTFKGKAVDIKQACRELGVRYVLEGSVRKTGNRLRVTGQLIDAQNGAHLWADRFDGTLADVFDLQDRVTESVVGAVMPQVTRAEIERARRKPSSSLDAYDCFLRGSAALTERQGDGAEEALVLFQRAIELDPRYAAPHGGAALCYVWRMNTGRFASRAADQAEVRHLAAKLSTLGRDDPDALCSMGAALLYVCRDYETGVALIDRAIELNPNLARGWTQRGWAFVFMGRHQAASEAADRALRLSPVSLTIGTTERCKAEALTFLGRHAEAVEWAERVLARQPSVMATLRVAAVAHALAGNTERAVEIGSRLREIDPALRLSALRDYLPYRRAEDIELFAEGLRRAGIPA